MFRLKLSHSETRSNDRRKYQTEHLEELLWSITLRPGVNKCHSYWIFFKVLCSLFLKWKGYSTIYPAWHMAAPVFITRMSKVHAPAGLRDQYVWVACLRCEHQLVCNIDKALDVKHRRSSLVPPAIEGEGNGRDGEAEKLFSTIGSPRNNLD